MLPAGGAIGLSWQFYTLAGVLPYIHPEHRPAYLLALEQYLESLGRSHAGNCAYNPIEYPRRITGRRGTRQRHLRENAAQTGCITWHNIHGHSIRGDHAAIDPRTPIFYAHVIEQVACLKVVGG